jgi:ribosome-associated heat shock protein Hsp15
MTSVRIDKWLWAARFFKTRSLAARACELGRVQSNGQPAKPAREVRIGDMVRVTNDGGEFNVGVLQLSDVRGPASVAQTLYRETEASRAPHKSSRRAQSHEAVRRATRRPTIETRPPQNHPVPRPILTHALKERESGEGLITCSGAQFLASFARSGDFPAFARKSAYSSNHPAILACKTKRPRLVRVTGRMLISPPPSAAQLGD